MAKGYTKQEWKKLIETSEGLEKRTIETREYAESKGVETRRIDVRWVRGRSQYFVRPESWMKNAYAEKMNND